MAPDRGAKPPFSAARAVVIPHGRRRSPRKHDSSIARSPTPAKRGAPRLERPVPAPAPKKNLDSPLISKRLAECQRVIGYHFTDEHQLEIALTHSSVRTPDRECNERLEFLGDSVLGLAITDELYKRLPDQAEGELTRIKSAVVSRGALYRASTRMGLVRFIEVAKGVGRREELPVSLTANLVESIIGAIYVDAGFFPAREFILRHLGPELEDVLNDRVAKNYKSLLQHEAQERMGVTPVYRTIEAEGPDHRRNFTVAAVIRGTEYGRASGINKKDAEQEAARHALEALQRSGRGRRRRSDGRGEVRGDVRPDPRDRVPVREPAGDPTREPAGEPARAPQDDDEWKRWAEAAKSAESAKPGAARGAPTSTPYAIGPEADDGWNDGPTTAPARDAAPPSELASAPVTDATAAPADDAPASDAEPRGRRRRRGGRGRGRSPSLDDGILGPSGPGTPTSGESALDPADRPPARTPTPSRRARSTPAASRTPDEPPADALLAAVFAEPVAAPSSTSSAKPDDAPTSSVPEPQAPRRVVKARTRAPAAEDKPAKPSAREPSRRAKAVAPATASPSEFGKGVEPTPTPRSPTVERAVTDVGSVSASKRAPVVPKPAAKGGFGDGL